MSRSFDSDARLRDIHAAYTTDDAVIREIIRSAVGHTINSYERIIKGESNQVYLVHLKSKTKIILRIGNKDHDRFALEAWAMDKARAAGVPVPAILASGTKAGVFYCIENYLDGVSLDDILAQGGSDTRLRFLTENAGRTLARLHRVKTTGYGQLSSSGVGKYADAVKWLSSYRSGRKRYENIFAAVGLSRSLLEALYLQIDQTVPLFKYIPHLLHNDYGPKHIFIGEQDHIIGIIDFEECASGDQTIDFAKWWYRYDKVAPTSWLIDGYIQAGGSLYDDFEERYKIAKSVRLLGTLSYFVNEQPSEKWATIAAATLRRIIQS